MPDATPSLPVVLLRQRRAERQGSAAGAICWDRAGDGMTRSCSARGNPPAEQALLAQLGPDRQALCSGRWSASGASASEYKTYAD